MGKGKKEKDAPCRPKKKETPLSVDRPLQKRGRNESVNRSFLAGRKQGKTNGLATLF